MVIRFSHRDWRYCSRTNASSTNYRKGVGWKRRSHAWWVHLHHHHHYLICQMEIFRPTGMRPTMGGPGIQPSQPKGSGTMGVGPRWLMIDHTLGLMADPPCWWSMNKLFEIWWLLEILGDHANLHHRHYNFLPLHNNEGQKKLSWSMHQEKIESTEIHLK